MPLYAKAEEWSHQTSLLLAARPTTTRITTKYTISPAPSAASLSASRAKRAAHLARLNADQTETAAGPKAVLELKTFCPESGVVLKYRTDKAAEVGRLIGQLGRMGRAMGGLEELPATTADVDMPDAAEGTQTPVAALTTTAAKGSKKKKGKK